MSKKFEKLTPGQIEFIRDQKLFFTGTAAEEGTVNISPKGMDSLRVLAPDKLIWLNFTGSGNETAAHLRKKNRMTLMFCSFGDKPLILRLYGHARIFHHGDDVFSAYLTQFPVTAGARQILEMQIDLVQTSCGFAVPYMEFREERPLLKNWAEKQGEEGIRSYWHKKNRKSIDGYETGIDPEIK